DADAVIGPEEYDAQELPPQRLPVVALEVEGVDVLILLGRVLGVLDGAVGPVAEPPGVLADVGVVGGALKGDFQGDVDAVLAGGGDQTVEVGQGAQLRVDGLVPALGAADGPGAAGVARPGRQGVVRALAEGAADG